MQKQRKYFLKTGLLLIFLGMFTACGLYRMPTDEDLQTVPVTNNPNVTRSQQGGNGGGMPIMPGISY